MCAQCQYVNDDDTVVLLTHSIQCHYSMLAPTRIESKYVGRRAAVDALNALFNHRA